MVPHVDLLNVPAHRRAVIEQFRAELVPGRRVALSTHINADGDGCGSETALARMLTAMGMDVVIVNPTPWPALFNFLLGDDVQDASASGPAALKKIDLLIVLDISDVKRLGHLADTVRALTVPVLVIDHHVPSDDPPAPRDRILSDTSACATGELIHDVAETLGLAFTPAIAKSLYTAMLTDTGGFRFSNTSPRCHAIASRLLSAGVDPEEMYRQVYASVPIGRIHLLRDALDTLEVDAEHGISWVSLGPGVLEKYGVASEDLDGIVEHPRSIAGTRLALFFRDLGHGKVKVSFRSTGSVDVNALARQYGGGGHAKASGALIAGSLADVRTRVVADARVFVAATKQHSAH
ncbi:MAG: bifunctional oligoribonuclease/PAP phosphatase NrnA [Gemmatimonadaceae bacterium]|nr:bifunctional oligoribonuclease/PAP phosphatase NrnA [Gemmatimonadaceae bacterium]